MEYDFDKVRRAHSLVLFTDLANGGAVWLEKAQVTNDERKQLKALIVTTSLYYRTELPDMVVRMQVQDLDDLPFTAVVDAYSRYRKDPVNRFSPLPAAIRAMVEPKSTDEEDARLVASRIIQAISRFGWTNEERAKEFLGDLGWEIVRLEGGWAALCQRLTDDQVATFKAQARELAKALITRAKAGTLDQAPALPSPLGYGVDRKSGPVPIGEAILKITKQEKKDG